MSFLPFFQSQLYMHLTNYSVNKHNERFERDETEDKGSKRSIKWFTEFLETNNLDVSKFWSDISVRQIKALFFILCIFRKLIASAICFTAIQNDF